MPLLLTAGASSAARTLGPSWATTRRPWNAFGGQRILGTKNSLTAADARQTEDAFRAKMAILDSAADVGGVS